MYNVKVYVGNYDKSEFYSVMGKFFAEKIYRKILPYLVNDKEKIWYLFFDENELAGFCGIRINNEYTNFSDIYVTDKYQQSEVLEFMCNYLFNLYKVENIKVLTNSQIEIDTWLKYGFKFNGEKGKYQSLVWVKQ